jgi:hypothetical protein
VQARRPIAHAKGRTKAIASRNILRSPAPIPRALNRKKKPKSEKTARESAEGTDVLPKLQQEERILDCRPREVGDDGIKVCEYKTGKDDIRKKPRAGMFVQPFPAASRNRHPPPGDHRQRY